MNDKSYFPELTELVPLVTNGGGCLVTDRLSIDGASVGYMYREAGSNKLDNGWRFFAGDETREYIDDLDNTAVFELNTIANHDPAILAHLNAPTGSAFERIKGTNKFKEVKNQ